MADKPFHEMTDEELIAEFEKWNSRAERATSWGAGYYQAWIWARAIEKVLAERGITIAQG